MLEAIKNELVSISDLKKSPMASIEIARKTHNGVYVLNNNRAVAVILDTQNYTDMIDNNKKLSAENEKLLDKIIELEAEKRIAMNEEYLSDLEVRGDSANQIDLSNIEDEWE